MRMCSGFEGLMETVSRFTVSILIFDMLKRIVTKALKYGVGCMCCYIFLRNELFMYIEF